MADAWGGAWGMSWGASWARMFAAKPVVAPEGPSAGSGGRRRHRRQKEWWPWWWDQIDWEELEREREQEARKKAEHDARTRKLAKVYLEQEERRAMAAKAKDKRRSYRDRFENAFGLAVRSGMRLEDEE